jgi:O-antigen/teichoic acid export membrane protein
VTRPAEDEADSDRLETESWAPDDRRQFATIARNVSTRYLAIGIEMLIGLLMLPFNLHHLGKEAYGLWMLTGSVTIHFSVLDMGYGGALVKFMAQYRAHRNARALNEIASTLFFVFAAVGLVAYLVAAGLAFNLDHIFKIDAAQAQTGKWILLIIGLNVAMNFPFSVFGGVISGFQRYDANNLVAIGSSALVALVNVAILTAGLGLIPLVIGTTTVRLLTYLVYRRNAYRIYPPLRIRWSLFRRSRLREVTGFSVYSSVIDWANKLNYELDEVVIGAFMGSGPVAVWAVADRIISGTQRLTNQLNGVLFPVVVESDATNRTARLQRLLLEGTRLSLAMVVPIAVTLILLATPLVRAWVGDKMIESAAVIQILAFAVALRVGNATGTTILKGSGRVRYLAVVNILTGVVNLALSAALIHPFGLIGVAVGTLAPIAFSSIFILFPAACRRVQLPIAHAFHSAVWPAVWPAVVVVALLVGTRQISSGTLLAVLMQAAGAALLYFAMFFGVAIGRRDRADYVAKLRQLIGRRRPIVPAAVPMKRSVENA